jgi:hypothetical protein
VSCNDFLSLRLIVTGLIYLKSGSLENGIHVVELQSAARFEIFYTARSIIKILEDIQHCQASSENVGIGRQKLLPSEDVDLVLHL